MEGLLKYKFVTILINTSSINNFLNSKVVMQLVYHIEYYDKFKVKFVDRQILTCNSKCFKVKFIM